MMMFGFVGEWRRMDKRQYLHQVLCLAVVASSALMAWKGLMVVTNSKSPIVVVLSGSMEPAFYRGDLLLLTNPAGEPVRAGDIVVFRVTGKEIPIVHRVVRVHERENGTLKFLTKGDNNPVDDRGLYTPGQLWLTETDVVGRAKGVLRYIGLLTIFMNEYPRIKYAIVATLGLHVLLTRQT
uniref:Signal peptidase complex catalytic subunit SEC11 n=1 Tax=Graphocephala atropunctata TaxID=36148 RepID=A0A1B6KJ13_9HEMI